MKDPQKVPTVFISSTIFDFRDLRSALKYYLEELGYTVNMSEFNDFKREPDANSYAACLQTVRECDYYILLIGSRAGGPYTTASGTSITQEESRAAYEGAKTGTTRILAFVRRDIWAVKDDRKSLANLLLNEFVATGELSDEAATKIAAHSSKFATDAAHIFSFIDEVCRVSEMKAAIRGDGPLPPANWVHQFETFRDIGDCLRIQFKFTSNLQSKILIQNLKDEVLSNLATLVVKAGSAAPSVRTELTRPFRQHYQLTIGEQVRAKCKHVLWLIMGSVQLTLPGAPLRTRTLERCIDVGVFLQFDTLTGGVSQTYLHRLLEQLRESVERFLACNVSNGFVSLARKYGEEAKAGATGRDMTVMCNDFADVVNAANRLDDVFLLSKLLYRCLNGEERDPKVPSLQPLSPFNDQNEPLAAERISADEVGQLLKDGLI